MDFMNTHTNINRGSLVLRTVRHVRTASAFRALAEWAGVSTTVADAAIDRFRSGDVVALLGSGAQGSGKDSVCPAVFHASGIVDGVQCRVAHAIRQEMQEVITHIEHAADPSSAEFAVVSAFNVSAETARLYVELFFEATRDAAHGIHVHERSERMRRALQWHGAEARTDQPGYWVKLTYRDVIPNLAEGRSVYLTDGRFPAEVDAGRTTGALCIRLWVPEATRIERIRTRDGIVPSERTLRHPGETALDGYWGLDAEIDNTQGLDETVTAVAEMLATHREQMRSIN